MELLATTKEVIKQHS